MRILWNAQRTYRIAGESEYDRLLGSWNLEFFTFFFCFFFFFQFCGCCCYWNSFVWWQHNSRLWPVLSTNKIFKIFRTPKTDHDVAFSSQFELNGHDKNNSVAVIVVTLLVDCRQCRSMPILKCKCGEPIRSFGSIDLCVSNFMLIKSESGNGNDVKSIRWSLRAWTRWT